MNKHRCFVESFRDFHGNIRSQMISVDNIFWDSPLIFTENPLSFFFRDLRGLYVDLSGFVSRNLIMHGVVLLHSKCRETG